MALTKKFVVLEHLTLPNRGFRFWSMNSENNTHSAKGELWYKEVLLTDDMDEAITVASQVNHAAVPNYSELCEYYRTKE